uniref:Putative glycerophosphoryl diester phosphodiesterase n=1 Tax=Panstrongylus lignarius TaxID=156445 RepID=A0A224XQU3_9HEMI
MPLQTVLNCNLACSCFYLWMWIFTIFVLAVEITNFYVLSILIAGPAVTYWLITSYAIPPPKESSVLEILGTELKGELKGMYSDYDSSSHSNEPNDFIMKVVAHRFAGIEAPENSLVALDLCYKNGAVAVEFDLVLTADFVPVIFHDITLDRITNIVGEITEKTWNELKDLDISMKHPFHNKFQGTRIPLFEDVIRKCMDYDLRLFIDVKDDRPEAVNVILRTYEKYPKMYRRSIVSSFNGIFLYNVRRANPDIVVSMAWRPYYMSYRKYSLTPSECEQYSTFIPTHCIARLMDHITTWLFNYLARDLIGLSAVLLCKDVITPETVLFWKERNVRLYAWTVNNPLEKLHLSRNLGVGYFTDSMLGQ